MKYLIGLDNGGTVTKAVLIDTEGKLLSKASRKISTKSERPLFVERDMGEVWEKNCQVIREVIEKSQVNRDDIIGLSISGHGKGLYPVAYGGKFVLDSILSTDNRAYEYTDRWREDGTVEDLRKYTYQDLIPVQVPALVNRLLDNKKEEMDQIEWFFGIKDFLRYMLTGVANAEITDFSGSGILDLNTRSYSDEIFKKLGLEKVKEKFPPLVKSTEVTGLVTQEASKATGLPIGCKVVAGAFDIDACAIAMGYNKRRLPCHNRGNTVHKRIYFKRLQDKKQDHKKFPLLYR
jgi:L-xylulokinase